MPAREQAARDLKESQATGRPIALQRSSGSTVPTRAGRAAGRGARDHRRPQRRGRSAGPRRPTFIQVDPHALAGAALSSSQKAVTKLFEQTLPEAALNGAAVILLDELETLAPARHKLSLEANPIDVHRATDAVLTGMDMLTRKHKNVLLIGTSNFPKAVDPAVVSRADLVEDIGLPD